MAELDKAKSLSINLTEGMGTTQSPITLSWEIIAENWNQFWGRKSYFGIKIEVVYATSNNAEISYQIYNNQVPLSGKFLNKNNFYNLDQNQPTNLQATGKGFTGEGVQYYSYTCTYTINNLNSLFYDALINKHKKNGILDKIAYLKELNSLTQVKRININIDYYYNWSGLNEKNRWRRFNFNEYNNNVGKFSPTNTIVTNKSFRPLNLNGENFIVTSDKDKKKNYVLLGKNGTVLSNNIFADQSFLEGYSSDIYLNPSSTYPNTYDKLQFQLKNNNQIISDIIEYNLLNKSFNKDHFTINSNDLEEGNIVIDVVGVNVDSNNNNISSTNQKILNSNLKYYDLSSLKPQLVNVNLSNSILKNGQFTKDKTIIYQNKEEESSNISWKNGDVAKDLNISYKYRIKANLDSNLQILIKEEELFESGTFLIDFNFKDWAIENNFKNLDKKINWSIEVFWEKYPNSTLMDFKDLYYFSKEYPVINPKIYSFKLGVNENENNQHNILIDKKVYLNPKDVLISDNINQTNDIFTRIKCGVYNKENDSAIIELYNSYIEGDTEIFLIESIFNENRVDRKLYISKYDYKILNEKEIPYEQTDWILWDGNIDFIFSRVNKNQINIKPNISFSNENKELYQVNDFNEQIQEDKKVVIPVLKVTIDLQQTVKNSDFGGNTDLSNLKTLNSNFKRHIDFNDIKYYLDNKELKFIKIDEASRAIWEGTNFKSYSFDKIDLNTFFNFEDLDNITFYLVDEDRLDGNNTIPLIGNMDEIISLVYINGPLNKVTKDIERNNIVIGSPTIYYRQHSIGINQEPNDEEVLFISPFENKKVIRMGSRNNYIQINLETLTITRVINGQSQDLNFN